MTRQTGRRRALLKSQNNRFVPISMERLVIGIVPCKSRGGLAGEADVG